MKDLGIINPNDACTYTFSIVESLAKCFPQLGLDDSASINALRDEFMDFKLSPAEHPAVDTYISATDDDKPRPGQFWNEVGRVKTFDGELRFPSLVKLMVGLLLIPSSNADSERGFFMLRNIHTDQRPTLKQSTIISLMSIKFNAEECCHDSVFKKMFLRSAGKLL